jgi:hypothetical protein
VGGRPRGLGKATRARATSVIDTRSWRRRELIHVRKINSKRLLAAALATGAATALGLTLVAAAPADSAKRGPTTAKIKMVFDPDAGPPAFTGDESVVPGQNLKIVNRTNPRQIGPHTFSLVEEGSLPVTQQQMRKCGRLELPVCLNVFKAHDVSKRFVVRKPDVDKGLEGWDTSFNDEVKGDTWYTETKFESETRPVTAAPGQTLYYFCLVHPEMQGSVGVLAP